MDKVAIVTGASRGIGRAIATELASSGMYVVVNFAGKEESATETLRLVREAGGDGEIYKANVANEAECKAMCDDVVKRLGKVDVLVNNAGITRDKLVMAMSDEDFKNVVDTNLLGTFHMIKILVRYMLKNKGGRIINIASVSGVLGNAGQANYSASKAGVIGLTKSVARELATKNICVNAVAPGFIETDMVKAMSEGAIEAGVASIPMKRLGQPEDIAAMVGFLASDKASYITGQVINVDGGMAI